MAELTIQPEDIRAALDSFVNSYEPAAALTEEVGHVTMTADGIARVEGLPGAMANELPSLACSPCRPMPEIRDCMPGKYSATMARDRPTASKFRPPR